jgi:hypothetical protein
MPIINPWPPAWHYSEFLKSGGTPTPNVGINAALTWLDKTITPPDGDGTVFGNIDSNGDVRLLWYGVEFPVIVNK